MGQWRIEKQTELEAQIGALRLKLDRELEEKWERSQDRSIFTSVFSNIIETVAPHPTITRRKSQILGENIDEIIDDELSNGNRENKEEKSTISEKEIDSKNSKGICYLKLRSTSHKSKASISYALRRRVYT